MTITARRVWEHALAWYEEAPTFERRAVLRSLYLRRLEQIRGQPSRWRPAAGALCRLGKAMIRRPSVMGSQSVVWVVAEAATPSHLGTALAVANVTDSMGLGTCLLVGDRRVGRQAGSKTHLPIVEVDCLPGRLPIGRRVAAAVRAGWCVLGMLGGLSPRLPCANRLQLAAEAGLAAVTRDSVERALMSSACRLVLAPSEYFAVGAGASEAVTKAGVPWVTVQHGVVNRTYAPSIADEYWVWTDEAASAMKTLLARGSQRVSVVGPLRFASQGQGSPGRTALSCSSGPRERTIVLFSQTHGLEYDKHVHEVLAVQVRRVLDRVADSRLIIKLHPSEHHSFYEELIGYGERVNVVSGAAVTATEAAKAGSCCLAFDSTALLEAILVGTVAVKVDSPCGGMAIQPVAAHTVRLDGVAIFVEALLTSEKRMEAALARQEERLPSLVPSTERAQVLWKEGIRRLCGEVLQ